jgi:hypothetical protein
MRLVLDQGVPREAAALLRALGHHCLQAGEIGPNGANGIQAAARPSGMEGR